MVNIPEFTSFKNWVSLSRKLQTATNYSTTHAHFPASMLGFCLIWTFIVLMHSVTHMHCTYEPLRFHMCVCLEVSRKHYCSHLLPLAPMIFLLLFEKWSLRLGARGVIQMFHLWLTKHSIVSYSLHNDQLWVFVLISIQWRRESSLMKVKRCTNICIW